MRRAILADRLVDMTGRPPLHDPVLLLDGDRIEQITTLAAWDPADVDAAEVHRYPGATLLPGLIDGHVHLAFNAGATTADVLDEYKEADDVRLITMAAENARRCLASGVTTVRDCGGPGTLIQSLRDAIAAGVTPGPRVIACGMPITTTAGHCHFFGLRVDDASAARQAVRQLVQDDADWIKVMATGGRMTRNSNILQAQYTRDEMHAIVCEARRLHRRVAAHALSVAGIRVSVEADVDTIEHCIWQDERAEGAYDEDLLRAIERQGIHISITIVGFMRQAYQAFLRDPEGSPLPEALRERYRMEADMFSRGLHVFITSDAGVPACHFDELYLSVAVAVDWHGLDPHTAIEAVTARAARALGIAERVGTLEVGKLADVLVVQGDPLADVSALARATAVYAGGRVLARDGAVLPSDARAVGTRPAATVRRHRWVPGDG
jgi:imidazolonepropionase-like amidohydrolase